MLVIDKDILYGSIFWGVLVIVIWGVMDFILGHEYNLLLYAGGGIAFGYIKYVVDRKKKKKGQDDPDLLKIDKE